MLLLALAAASTLGTQPAATAVRCRDAVMTTELNACLGHERDEAMAVLERYRAAARAHVIRDRPELTEFPAEFDAAQAAWLGYQKSQCGAVFTLWREGTIRGAMILNCEIRMAELRTHELWHDWLTYVDSTPPVLPEPVVARGS